MNRDRQIAERPSPHTPHPVQTGGVHVRSPRPSLCKTSW